MGQLICDSELAVTDDSTRRLTRTGLSYLFFISIPRLSNYGSTAGRKSANGAQPPSYSVLVSEGEPAPAVISESFARLAMRGFSYTFFMQFPLRRIRSPPLNTRSPCVGASRPGYPWKGRAVVFPVLCGLGHTSNLGNAARFHVS